MVVRIARHLGTQPFGMALHHDTLSVYHGIFIAAVGKVEGLLGPRVTIHWPRLDRFRSRIP